MTEFKPGDGVPEGFEHVLMPSNVVTGIAARLNDRSTYTLGVPAFCEWNGLVPEPEIKPGMWVRREKSNATHWVHAITLTGRVHTFYWSNTDDGIREMMIDQDSLAPGEPWSDVERVRELAVLLDWPACPKTCLSNTNPNIGDYRTYSAGYVCAQCDGVGFVQPDGEA